jgi:hypothetical protein
MNYYIGIDIQVRRNCCYAVVNTNGALIDSGWFDRDVRVSTDFSACKPGPKDMLDALVAAATVRECAEGRGSEVGGGDGLGTIILPRRLPEPVIEEILAWPGQRSAG